MTLYIPWGRPVLGAASGFALSNSLFSLKHWPVPMRYKRFYISHGGAIANTYIHNIIYMCTIAAVADSHSE